jgi:PhnB protein
MAKKSKSKARKSVKKAAKAANATAKKQVKGSSRTSKVKNIQGIPAGYEKVVPYIIVNDGVAALDFYRRAFKAVELYRFDAPGGKIAHAEFKIGDSNFMIADEVPTMDALSPATLGGSPVGFYIYVKDVDAFFARALSEGAKELQPLEDKFYGDRTGSLIDPYGHKWTFGTHKVDVSQEEMKKKMEEMRASSTEQSDSSKL